MIYFQGKWRYPYELKGKEIGMYYKNKQKERDQNKNALYFSLSPHLEQMIKSVVSRSHNYFEMICEKSISECDNKYNHIHDSQFKRKFLEIISGDIQHNLAKAITMESRLQRSSNIDRMLLNEYKEKQMQNDYLKMLKFRIKLPTYEKKSEILQLIENNQVVVISGETGKLQKLLINKLNLCYEHILHLQYNCIYKNDEFFSIREKYFLYNYILGCGKSTQIAQFILDDQLEAGNGSVTRIVCTQPRRISAISVAERVAAERAEKLGKSVGYQIRLEKYIYIIISLYRMLHK